MSVRVYVPCDATALSMCADRVAAAIEREAARRGVEIDIRRNGSRGLCWLEPLVEVLANGQRIGYGPVQVEDVESLFDAGFLEGRGHPLSHGPVEAIPYYARQQRLAFARVGVIEPTSIADYVAHGGYEGLRAAQRLAPEAIVQVVIDSGLRGRGGAAFPTGIKWKTVLGAAGSTKYITCNADEGDSGTFADRMLMEGDPHLLIEGMAIAALATGATMGYIYLRVEYPHAHRTLLEALSRARAEGYLGRGFDIEVRLGAGAYICGEETSMLESLEGRRGEVRVRPPLPAIKGLFGCPTVVNNVITFASVPVILAKGAAHYRDHGVGRSRGTLPLQLAGNLKHGGLVELAFGVTLRELLYDYGGGSATGRPIRAVQIGGPLGAYLPESQFDIVIDYEALAGIGAMLGHGGIVAFDNSADLTAMARHAMEFCALESCGKCTPCRIGSKRGVEVIDRVRAGVDRTANLELLESLCETMTEGSLCGLGGMTAMPVRSLLQHFGSDFGRSG